jgi:hypothetical protein
MNARIFGLLPLLLLLGACGFSSPMEPEQRSSLDTCRSEANRVFNAQHPDQLSQRDSSDSPFSGNTLAYDPNKGLSDQYENDQMVNDCLHGDTGVVSHAEPAITDTPSQP